MKRFSILLIFMLIFISCKQAVKDTATQNQTYGNTTEYTKQSADKIDGSPTYEISFTLEKPADCMSIEIESVYLHKTFPLQKVPKNTFFIVEKKLNLSQFNIKGEKSYTQIGRNYNNEWAIYSPVKICTSKNEPLSTLDVSEYRIRFTVFEKTPVYYIIKVTCESKIIFSEYTPRTKK